VTAQLEQPNALLGRGNANSFYSTLAPPEPLPADQRIRRSSRVSGRRHRYASVGAGFRGTCGPRTGTDQPTDGGGKATDGAGGSGYTDRPARLYSSDLAFQDYLLLPSSLSTRVHARGRVAWAPRTAMRSPMPISREPAPILSNGICRLTLHLITLSNSVTA
jgi:hypothetical protein